MINRKEEDALSKALSDTKERVKNSPTRDSAPETEKSEKKHWRLRLLNAGVKLQKELKAKETGGQGQFTYKYLPIQKILEEGRIILKEQSLGFMQTVEFVNITHVGLQAYVVTIIFDLNEPEKPLFVSNFPVPRGTEEKTEKPGRRDEKKIVSVNETAQSVGANLTYIRRYSLYCCLGIQPEEDKDGLYEN